MKGGIVERIRIMYINTRDAITLVVIRLFGERQYGFIRHMQIRIIPFGAANYFPVHETLRKLNEQSPVRKVWRFFLPVFAGGDRE